MHPSPRAARTNRTPSVVVERPSAAPRAASEAGEILGGGEESIGGGDRFFVILFFRCAGSGGGGGAGGGGGERAALQPYSRPSLRPEVSQCLKSFIASHEEAEPLQKPGMRSGFLSA